MDPITWRRVPITKTEFTKILCEKELRIIMAIHLISDVQNTFHTYQKFSHLSQPIMNDIIFKMSNNDQLEEIILTLPCREHKTRNYQHRRR